MICVFVGLLWSQSRPCLRLSKRFHKPKQPARHRFDEVFTNVNFGRSAGWWEPSASLRHLVFRVLLSLHTLVIRRHSYYTNRWTGSDIRSYYMTEISKNSPMWHLGFSIFNLDTCLTSSRCTHHTSSLLNWALSQCTAALHGQWKQVDIINSLPFFLSWLLIATLTTSPLWC